MERRQHIIAGIGCCLLLWASFWVMAAPIQAQSSGTDASNSILAATKVTPTAVPRTGEEGMLAFIQKLQKEKKLGKEAENGTYYTLEDFEKSEPKLDYFFWYNTEYAPKNFILRADVEWESASKTANWNTSGFGVVFHESEDHNYFYLLQVQLDGNVKVWRVDMTKENYLNERWVLLAEKYYGKLETPKGQAHLDLIVHQDRVYVYLNNKLAVSAYDNPMKAHPHFGEGNLAFTVLSGTNAGFGTWVKMSNIELWEMKSQK